MIKRISWKRRLIGLAGSVVVMALVGLAVAYAYPQAVLTVDSGPVTADALVVLGGGPPERPMRAAELFKAGAAPLIICSGVGDAKISQAVLLQAGVPAANILLEGESRTTKENAKFTIALLRARHLTNAIIVTSWFHSRRARACFQHYAPDLQFYSRPTYYGYPPAEWETKGVSNYVKAEYVKLLGYWVCYGVGPW